MKAGSANKKSFWDIPWFKYAFIPLIVAVLAGVVLNLIFRNQSDDSSTKEKLKESKEIISQDPKKLDTSSLRDIPESGEISIQIMPISNDKELESVLNQMRVSLGLRKLTPLETGKRIEETPTDTFFFVSPRDLSRMVFFSGKNYFEVVKREAVVDNKRNFIYYDFELHYVSEDGLYLIGFVSEDVASSISKLDGKDEKKIILISYPWINLNTLIRLPIKRIVEADSRSISANDDEKIEVLDVVIK